MTTTLKVINKMAKTPPGMTVGGNITLNGGSHIYTTNTTGSAGQIYTTNGTSNTFTWANPTPPDNVMKINQSPPELDIKGRVIINGVDLEERLNTIEKVLQIPERDVKLEKKHPKLQEMYYDYINALAKYRMWEAIKGDDNVA